jgi:hypothetical protein
LLFPGWLLFCGVDGAEFMTILPQLPISLNV